MKRLLFPIFAIALPASSVQAAILYSGQKNITITNSFFTSVYIDIDDLAGSGSSTRQSGWDVNTFFGGEGFGNSMNFQPVRESATDSSAIVNLTNGSLVAPSQVYFNAPAGSTTHIGTNSGQFASGSDGFIGFKLIDNSAAGPYFGWMRVNFSNTGASGTVVDWAYDNTGSAISVGAVPEPGSIALLVLAGTLILLRREKRDRDCPNANSAPPATATNSKNSSP